MFCNWFSKKYKTSAINKDKANQDLKHFEDFILTIKTIYMDYGDGVTNGWQKLTHVEKKHLVAEGKEIVLTFMEVCSKYIDDKEHLSPS
jgi:hypothetical protein